MIEEDEQIEQDENIQKSSWNLSVRKMGIIGDLIEQASRESTGNVFRGLNVKPYPNHMIFATAI